jgi:transcriptional regulator with XRE-family HTH domain
MTNTKRRGPELHPMDMHIGRQMRLRRQILVLSQMDLAARLNISYQQLQKYETGRNRISASRLYQTAQCLGVLESRPAVYTKPPSAWACPLHISSRAQTR